MSKTNRKDPTRARTIGVGIFSALGPVRVAIVLRASQEFDVIIWPNRAENKKRNVNFGKGMARLELVYICPTLPPALKANPASYRALGSRW